MKTKISILAAALSAHFCLTDLALAADPAPPAPPAAAFGQAPSISRVAINPAGNMLGWIDTSTPLPRVVMFDLQSRSVKRTLNLPAEMKLRDVDWADDETLLIDISLTHGVNTVDGRRRYEFFRTLAADTNGGETRVLLLRDEVRSLTTGSRLIALRTSKPKTVIMSMLEPSLSNRPAGTDSRIAGRPQDSGIARNLFEVDTRTGVGKRIRHGTPFTVDWIVDKNGEPVARSEWEPENRLYYVMRRNGEGWTEIYRNDELPLGSTPALIGLTRDGTGLIALGAIDEPGDYLSVIPLDGSEPKPLLDDWQYEVAGVTYDPYSGQPVGVWAGAPRNEHRWLDSAIESRYRALAKAFSDLDVDLLGRSADSSRWLVSAASHAKPAIYYLVDYKKGTADIVGEQFPALAQAQLGSVREISYKARDGMEIPAYLTLPPGIEAVKLPLVVLPHGGPEAHDSPEFDWLAQFLATRGYAVLQPQFRGSTGYGEAFRKAGYRQWGGLMQDDVTDGVKSMIDQGLADAQRVCIVGASYGGYAALAGATFTPEIYACAASINGVSDLPYMFGHVTQHFGVESGSLSYWKDHIGLPQDPAVIAKSPARAARNIRAPILLLHGADDQVVPIVQSETMARALKENGKPHTFIKLPGEDHWLSRSESRVRILTELETFLAASLVAKP